MRKKKFGKLLTVSLSEKLFKIVNTLSEQYEISMGEVVRKSIEYSMHYDGSWLASKKKPFTSSKEAEKNDFSSFRELQDEDMGEQKTNE